MIFDNAGNAVPGPAVPLGGIDTAAALVGYPIAPNNPFEQWVDAFIALGNAVPLTTARTALVNAIAGWSRIEAIAASVLQRGIDALIPGIPAIAFNAQATLANLPRREWWRLFIDVAQQAQGPMTFDYNDSPGYYRAMMTAFDLALVAGGAHYATAGFANAFAWYDQLHQDVVAGVFHQIPGPAWALVGNNVSGNGGFTSYGIQHPPDPIALQEMRDEGLLDVIGAPGAFTCRYNPVTGRVSTTYLAAAVPGLVNAEWGTFHPLIAGTQQASAALQQLAVDFTALAGHAQTAAAQTAALGSVGDPDAIDVTGKLVVKALNRADQLRRFAERQQVRNIARIIRALHVGHYYTDANGRLNTMLFLNRLLIGAGLSPAIVADTSIFGGSQSVDTLAQAIVDGAARFQAAVPRA